MYKCLLFYMDKYFVNYVSFVVLFLRFAGIQTLAVFGDWCIFYF